MRNCTLKHPIDFNISSLIRLKRTTNSQTMPNLFLANNSFFPIGDTQYCYSIPGKQPQLTTNLSRHFSFFTIRHDQNLYSILGKQPQLTTKLPRHFSFFPIRNARNYYSIPGKQPQLTTNLPRHFSLLPGRLHTMSTHLVKITT